MRDRSGLGAKPYQINKCQTNAIKRPSYTPVRQLCGYHEADRRHWQSLCTWRDEVDVFDSLEALLEVLLNGLRIFRLSKNLQQIIIGHEVEAREHHPLEDSGCGANDGIHLCIVRRTETSPISRLLCKG